MTNQSTAASMTSRQKRLNATILLLILVVFLGPLFFAVILYLKQDLLPLEAHNHGTLINPPTTISAPLDEYLAKGTWWIVGLAPEEDSKAPELLTHIHQIQGALGKEEKRVKVLYLQTPHAHTLTLRPEWSQKVLSANEAKSHFGVYLQNPEEGGIFLVDPLGFMVLSYPAQEDPNHIFKDLKRLLRVSQIG